MGLPLSCWPGADAGWHDRVPLGMARPQVRGVILIPDHSSPKVTALPAVGQLAGRGYLAAGSTATSGW
jgi:hypothetical protein